MTVVGDKEDLRPEDPTEDMPDQFPERDTQVTLLYKDMTKQILRSSRAMDATCVKAEKFRRLAKNHPQAIRRLISERPSKPTNGSSNGK